MALITGVSHAEAPADAGESPHLGKHAQKKHGHAAVKKGHKVAKKNHAETAKLRGASSSDDTVSTSSIGLENTYVNQIRNASKNTTKLSGTYAFGGHHHNDWALKLGIPFVYINPGDNEKKTEEGGLGDLTFKATRSFQAKKHFRIAPSVKCTSEPCYEPPYLQCS